LLFQALDEKEKCVGIYADGKILKDLPEGGTQTWKYSSFLKDINVDYAQMYCDGKSLGEVCPPELKEEYDRIWKKLKAFYKSFSTARVSLDDHCFFDLVPEGFLKQFCMLKDKITEHVLTTYDRPKNYENLVEITKLVTDIKQQRLNIDLSCLNNELADPRTKDFYRKIMKMDPYIKYNPFGTKTGRLTTEKNSFPILTMDKKFRKIIKPTNDWFVELDYNAAEVRVLLGLLGKSQPHIDLHDYNAYELFGGTVTRDAAKKKLFSWLYNPNAEDETLSRLYDRDTIKKLFWDGNHVKTMYHREIPSDEYHALNYIIQSTCSDLIMDRATVLSDMLEGKKTKIAFIIHDSIVLDYADEDGDYINMVYWEFMTTPFGRFKANVAGGRNFGEMKDLWIS
jgi:hypothetical protein|tara:strand:+ start:269 stop:1456 length:1188 start_codon:yes stop_codon:yes gene_type:complete